MQTGPDEARLDWRRPLLAGLGLSVVLVVFVLARAWSVFLSLDERWRYVFAALSTSVAASVLLWLGMRLLGRLAAKAADPDRAVGRFVGLVAAATGALLAWSLTAGRRVRDASWRELGVVGVAVVGGIIAQAVTRRLRASGTNAPLAGVMALGAITAIVVDGLVLLRLYPAFHLGLALVALCAANVAAWKTPLGAFGRGRVGWPIAAIVIGASCVWMLPRLGAHPNARFVALERAPLVGKLMPFVAPAAPAPEPAAVAAPTRTVAVEEGIDLRDADVLLVTIDALRADRLGPYGGSGLTPHLDTLADESRVFLRAYTPTPHTSYALTSLLTGKYLRPVLELPDAPEDHPAMPELLRQYGYRTAAFYPPAIFFVDAHRFRALAANDFGFEYRKVMFAPAAARVAQLDRYLREVEEGHPVFAWVHLFEPHEPYDPPPEFRRGNGRGERYDGEVAAADAAVGGLVEVFRRHRPGGTVIVTADHGEELGDHGGWYHGTTLYDEQVRVPLLWSSPEQSVAGRTEVPVEILDIATTLLSAIGIPRDARMRGDDLGAVLRGVDEAGPQYAFAEVDRERMVVDGHYKTICGEAGCRLFDLSADPGERENLGLDEADRMGRMEQAIGAFIGSIPRIEAMSVGEGRWPEPLARAELGDRGAAADVVPLLGDSRPDVRSAAARALGELGHRAAVSTLARLRSSDPEDAVREEAAVAGLMLGDDEAREAVAAACRDDARGRRAALALGRAEDARAAPVLEAVVLDVMAEESLQVAAIDALGRLRAGEGALVQALSDVRLRPSAVRSLAAVGGRRAADAIAGAMENERYLPARSAEATALFALGDRRAVPLTRRFLGVDTPFNGGVALLLEHGALEPPSAGGASLRNARVRSGQWSCGDAGCVPGEGAVLTLPGTGGGRAVFLAVGEGTLTIDGVAHAVSGTSQVAMITESRTWRIGGDAVLRAVVVVPVQEEIPPPPPEPWEEEDEAS